MKATFKDFQASVSGRISDPVFVSTRHASIPGFTPATVAQLVRMCENMPEEAWCAISLIIAHCKATRPNAAASFGTRKAHILLHINAITDAATHEAIGAGWCDGVVAALEETGETLGPTYLNFMGLQEPAHRCFSTEAWERLKAVKRRVDPEDVFRFSQPQLPVSQE